MLVEINRHVMYAVKSLAWSIQRNPIRDASPEFGFRVLVRPLYVSCVARHSALQSSKFRIFTFFYISLFFLPRIACFRHNDLIQTNGATGGPEP